MKIYIVSNNQNFHCSDDEQHIVKIFDTYEKALACKDLIEGNSSESFDIISWEVE